MPNTNYLYDYSDSAQNLLISPAPAVATSATTTFVISSLTVLFILAIIACAVLAVVGRWKIFKKAGEEGWKSMIPIYSDYTMFRILSMEPLLCIISSLPVSHFVLNIVIAVKLAKSFHKSTGFAVGLILLEPIFIMILGFGSAKYTKLPSSR